MTVRIGDRIEFAGVPLKVEAVPGSDWGADFDLVHADPKLRLEDRVGNEVCLINTPAGRAYVSDSRSKGATARLGHNRPPQALEEPHPSSTDRVQAMRERDRAAGVVAHPVRVPEPYTAAMTVLARILRDGDPATRRRVLLTIANLETKHVMGKGRDDRAPTRGRAWAGAQSDPAQAALETFLESRRMPLEDALRQAALDQAVDDAASSAELKAAIEARGAFLESRAGDYLATAKRRRSKRRIK
ncbi:MAG: hypothetical protein RLW87_20635 [Alphaproteobacteria bacterium]